LALSISIALSPVTAVRGVKIRKEKRKERILVHLLVSTPSRRRMDKEKGEKERKAGGLSVSTSPLVRLP